MSKELEKIIKEEIVIVQTIIQNCQKQIKSLDDKDTLFPFWNCKLHSFEAYLENLENI